MLSIHSHCIDEILSASEQSSQRAVMLFDRYLILNSEGARKEFVAALIHRILVEHTRSRFAPINPALASACSGSSSASAGTARP
jgi:hypothetical protein